MKRLSLNAFKAKNKPVRNTDQLLDQVLGNCHDGPTLVTAGGGGNDDDEPIIQ